MIDLLFYLFIYPIEWVMQAVLTGLFFLTGNYGLSIIGLSIVINVLISPLYYLAEHLKIQHQLELNKLKPKINLIKSKHQGQERHLYLSALYKIYNYHPLESVKASLGLLLQIPFFFAAFHLLGNYPVFDGISFGVISDLGQADKLLFGQNLLPILMTLINLASAYFYSKNMAKSDQYQLWGLSVIFLVVLYFESAALLLYWTMNNVFSLAKNWLEVQFNVSRVKEGTVKFFNKAQDFFKTDNAMIMLVSIFSFLVPVMHFYAFNKHKFAFDYRVFILLSPALLMIAYGLLCKRYFPNYWQKLLAMGVISIMVVYAFNPIWIRYQNELGFFISHKIKIFLCLATFFTALAYYYFHKLKIYIVILLVLVLGFTARFISQRPYQETDHTSLKQLAEGFLDLSLKQGFKSKPNIYYLVPDSYPSYESLLTEFKSKEDTFNNIDFYQQLERHGFKTYKNAYSNYEHTNSSMFATWMIRHHYNYANRSKELDTAVAGKNKVLATLINNNYHIYHNYNCQKFYPTIYCLPSFELQHSLYLDIISYYLGYKMTIKLYNVTRQKNTLPLVSYDGVDDFSRVIPLTLKKTSPKFVYIHGSGLMGTKPLKESAALVNNDLLSAVKLIQKEDSNAIIIIQSDHGSRQSWTYRSKQSNQTAQQVFGILFAVKWPKECQRFNQVKALSPVNLFQYVFACTMDIDRPRHLEANDSYQYGLQLRHLWNSEIDKQTWKRIENGMILEQPIKMSPEDISKLLQSESSN